MRVLIVTPDYPPAPGGIQAFAQGLATQLGEAHDVRVLTLGSPAAASALHAPGVTRISTAGGHRLAVAHLNARLLTASRWKPDVILALHIALAPALWLAGRLGAAPRVLVVYAKELVASPRLARLAIAETEAVIAISAHSRSLALAAGAAPEQVRIIHPGLATSGPPPVARTRSGRRPTVLTVARMDDPHKGHDTIIEALPWLRERVPAIEWILVGDGALRPELERRARECGCQDIASFAGSVSDAARDALLERADVFAMPSRVPADGGGEGFGIAFLEAGARGVPVVAGKEGGALDAVLDGETGLLVDPRDPQALAGAVGSLLTDRELASAMGEAGRAWATRHRWPVIAAQVDSVLRQVSEART